jgi:hypothetical protein
MDAPFVTPIGIGWEAFANAGFYYFSLLFAGLDTVFPLWLVQRALFFVAVFLLGVGGYGLLRERTIA